MKRLKYKYLTVALMVFGLTACDFGDTNVDPTRPADAPLSLILPAAITQSSYNVAALGGRMPGILVQHFAGFDAQQVAYTNYIIGESDMNNLWNTGLYLGSMKDADLIIAKAAAENQPYYGGIGKVLMAQNLGMATSFWGDIPYNDAFKGIAQLKPAYDSQESVYASIQRLLDEAIADFSKPAVAGGPAATDLIHGGNAARWIKTAKALKARYYLHLSKRDAGSYGKVLSALNGSYASTAEQAAFKFANSQTGGNPYYLFGIGRPKTMIIHKNFAKLLDDKADPRKPKLMVADGAEFLFYQNGNTNLYWSQLNAAIPLISYTETKFMEAEAKLMTGDESGAAAALKAGIEANMAELKVDGTAYTGKYGNFDGLTTRDQKLARVLGEKHVALYAQSEAELWTDYRRTGFPALVKSPNGVNGTNPSGILPRRFMYPLNERTTNSANLDAAIKRQGKGTGLLDDDMWAFQ